MILDKSFPPDPRVENEALALISAGHEVFLFCLDYQGQLPAENYKEIQIRRYQSNQIAYKLSALAYPFPFYRFMMSPHINHFLRENAIEVIHVHDMVIADTVLYVNKGFKLPVVLDLHENRPEIMKSYPHLQKFPGKFLISTSVWKEREGELVRAVDRVVVVTKEAREELKMRARVEEQKIAVVPNTVSSNFSKEFSTDLDIINRYKNKFVILYLGDTGLRRGLISMIEACSEMASKHGLSKRIKLVVVGQNSSDAVLKKRVQDLGITGLVDFEGWQTIEKFPSYLQVASVGVSPLHRNLHHDTTFANKIFQYMSFGVPVLASDALSQKNLLEEVNSGLIHKAEDVEDITAKLLKLYHNPELMTQLGANGRRFIDEDFNWEKVSDKLKSLYLDFEKV